FMFALAFVFFYFLISKDTGYLIYIIISFILYPFARALIDLMFVFNLRHLLDKQNGVTYYFNQLLFLLDFILYILSLFFVLFVFIIISFILYPFAIALNYLMFGFKLRHLLDKQKGVTYYFNQLLFLLDFILYHLSLFVAPIAIIVLLIRYIIIKIKH